MAETKKQGFRRWLVTQADASSTQPVEADYMTLEQGCLCFWKFGGNVAGTSTLSESFSPGAWSRVRMVEG